ncbi:hypothetical protein [Streptomyces sp. AC555_RSS877]|uniref:hypothetical protein n=1 Tax=Streptomyces sp. AC555_RSS877 TaxID=2823688 RepID=UPI001C272F2F|nr:hypothetical protein [Streptomyces sp. AC555_RSS877]
MRTLLDSPGLEGVPDTVRLAVVVLAARTPSETGVVEIRARELGRWLGLSESRVRHAVVPGLRRSGVVDVDTLTGEFGEDWGLTCRVLPMWEAQNKVGHPLQLPKPELATLLRLMEALMAPGWAHRDGRVTPAGLLGARTGHGAAADRLALLLLVLETAESGRVRLCGGTVNKRYGRPVATLARLLGSSLSRAERVLARLEDAGLVERPRRQTVSRLRQVSRLVVPAVAAAHSGRQGTTDGRVGNLAGTAWPSQDSLSPTKPQTNEAREGCGTDEGDLAATTPLHAVHSSVADVFSDAEVDSGFSGSAVPGSCGRPKRASTREDQAADGETAVAQSAPPVAEDGPLRGAKPKESPVEGRYGQRAARTGAGGRPKAVGWEKTQQQRRVDLPAHLGLRVALRPVAGLWERLSGWQQVQVEAAAKAEVKRLAGMLMRPEAAPQLLADRFTDRLEETGGEALVDRPYPWLIRRGLVQRQACTDRRCDDGIRLDTGGECESCGNVVHIRRAGRAKVAAEIDRELPSLGGRGRRQVLEERLREHTRCEAEQAGARHAQAVAEVEMRRVAAARRRAAEEAAALERLSAACVECGLLGAAGLCPECTYRRRMDVLVQDAVDLAVAVRADLDDSAQIAALSERCEADTRALVDDVCRRQAAADQSLMAFIAREVAERIRDERRASAHQGLLRSEEAEAEAEAVYDTVLRRRPRCHQAAEEAADEARRRTAHYMLEHKLGQLRAQRARMQAGRAPTRVG